jgi:Cu2+-exporting ATPase
MLDVSGMMCGGCSASVKKILQQQPGVQNAAVNLITHAAAVTVR